MGLLRVFPCEYHFPTHFPRLSSAVWPSVFFPGATNREPARRDVTKRRATSTKTNHRPDIYFLLFRGNRATRCSFSNRSPPPDDGFLFSGIAYPSANPHAPFFPNITRVNPAACHVSISSGGLSRPVRGLAEILSDKLPTLACDNDKYEVASIKRKYQSDGTTRSGANSVSGDGES